MTLTVVAFLLVVIIALFALTTTQSNELKRLNRLVDHQKKMLALANENPRPENNLLRILCAVVHANHGGDVFVPNGWIRRDFDPVLTVSQDPKENGLRLSAKWCKHAQDAH